MNTSERTQNAQLVFFQFWKNRNGTTEPSELGEERVDGWIEEERGFL